MDRIGLESFSPHLHDTFVSARDGAPVRFVLMEAAPLNGAPAGAAFELIFHSQSPTLFPQDLYRLGHPVIGECEIFLVPVGRHDNGFVYQAVFN